MLHWPKLPGTVYQKGDEAPYGVRPIVPGKWIEVGGNVWQCDQCGEITTNVHDNYCRHCGATMSKEEE